MCRMNLIGSIVAVMEVAVTTTGLSQMQIMASDGHSLGVKSNGEFRQKAPIAISGDNILIAWSTNSTVNKEAMFRASTDSGATFGEKINLSNSSGSHSTRAELGSDGANVAVTWWETNQTDDTPVTRILVWSQ
jgi:hypothetical protein